VLVSDRVLVSDDPNDGEHVTSLNEPHIFRLASSRSTVCAADNGEERLESDTGEKLRR
jgi:hypothetical protein